MTDDMVNAGDLRSGKGHKDENFPVASRIIHPRHRALILAFYNFVRTADDIADHAALSETEKLSLLDQLASDLVSDGVKESIAQPESIALRHALAARAMAPKHALDVLTAFRMDVTKRRYENWEELIHYCSYSAMPVGRFMLDVHGEDRSTWAASDALCAALQINNHLQDCGDDFRNLDRVYIPRDLMTTHGVTVEALGASQSSSKLLSCLHDVAERIEPLLRDGAALGPAVRDFRLGCEISVIQIYAERILKLLKARDPLSQSVHLTKWQMMMLGVAGMAKGAMRHLGSRAHGAPAHG
jgi:squalene synthase HpnC